MENMFINEGGDSVTFSMKTHNSSGGVTVHQSRLQVNDFEFQTKSTPASPPPPAAAMNSTSRKPNRLFSEADEIDLLNSVLYPGETPFPDDRVSAPQIADKIRRLKQKYHKSVQNKSSIKTPHDRDIYEIARNIWGEEKTGMPLSSSKPKEKEFSEEKGSIITTNWSDFPFLMKHVSRAFPGCEEVYKEGLKGLGDDILKGFDEKWMELDMEEAAIEARRNEYLN